MLNNVLTIAISLITLGSLSAQSFIGKINPSPNTRVSALADDTVKILAVMVNFQEDRDGATFGNGKFGSIYSQNYGNDILDPLPHDRDYFESHLTFVKNYFQKVSNGKVDVQFTILPDTFSVTKTMRNYSPAPGSDDFTPMGQFAEEVWTKADEMYPGLAFSDYNLFVIFHAGVGRDISLPGSLGNERDLPSVYLGENSLKNIFGSTFEGFPVSNGTFKIKNSMIIPETESRELETITGKFLFEITINGLIAASVASHLGLPDLFDTNTGLSAIGRFGLMDGQSIFAYNGCFPSEPSAWEKIYLGWAEPVEISPGDYSISLAANLASTLSDTVILKVPINSSEYYLIENRQRDVLDDGARVTIKSNGNIFTRTFLKDTTGFYSYDTDSLSGVVLDVDEFDWALPGNGIVVWHIDENVINEKLADNKINTDKTRRGVDVEEADGVQDIGETFITIFGDQVIGEGTEQDFWFADNKATLFKNIFNKDSRPDTRTNTGANSLITIKDFSSISNRMSFKIEYGDSIIKPLFRREFFDSNVSKITVLEDGDSVKFAFADGSDLLVTDGNNIISTLPDFHGGYKIASAKIGDKIIAIGNSGNKIYYWISENSQITSGSLEIMYDASTSPVIRKTLTENYELIIGTTTGYVVVYDLASVISGNPTIENEYLIASAHPITNISASSTSISIIANSSTAIGMSTFYSTNGVRFEYENENLIDLITTVDKSGSPISVVLTSSNKIIVFEISSSFTVKADSQIRKIAFADIKQDGENYIVLTNGNKLEAYNVSGALAENFPVNNNSISNLRKTPLAVDFEGDTKSDIISSDSEGNVYAFDGGTGKMIDGFPISFGSQLISNPVLFNYKGQTAFGGFNEDQYFVAWIISSVSNTFGWLEENGNRGNTSFLSAASNSNTINEFFPTSRAYNYPNPVYDGETAIRYFVSEDSKINIKIFDLAGDYVAELNDDAQGGLDNETVWNVGNIQSGVYLVRIEAIGSSGKSESVIIKIAVVK
jgi:hypothetical protein